MRLLGARLVSPAALLLSLRRHLQAASVGAGRHLQPVHIVWGPLLHGPPTAPLPQLWEGRQPALGRRLSALRDCAGGSCPGDACGAARRGQMKPHLTVPLRGWWGPCWEGLRGLADAGTGKCSPLLPLGARGAPASGGPAAGQSWIPTWRPPLMAQFLSLADLLLALLPAHGAAPSLRPPEASACLHSLLHRAPPRQAPDPQPPLSRSRLRALVAPVGWIIAHPLPRKATKDCSGLLAACTTYREGWDTAQTWWGAPGRALATSCNGVFSFKSRNPCLSWRLGCGDSRSPRAPSLDPSQPAALQLPSR